MCLLLLAFGGMLSMAGMALTAGGVSLHDRIFDMTIVTPGVIIIVGGFLLIGFGLVLQVLQQIEQTLTSGQVAPVGPAAPSALMADDVPEQARVAVRRKTTRAIEEADLPSATAVASPSTTSVDLAIVESKQGANGKAKKSSSATPLYATAGYEPPRAEPARTTGGRSFGPPWPKGPRPIRAAPAVPAQAAVMAPAEPDTSVVSAAAVVQAPVPDAAAPSPEPVSVLKSGVIDGMSYTLYSDGSIEAQLPHGRLRFGSITALRNHIEQSA